MDYLTVNEFAELKGCRTQYIRKLCKDGKLPAEQRLHPQNKKMCYMIPVSALPEELQGKYYGRIKAEINLPALKDDKKPLKQQKKTVSKSLEEMSEAERQEAARWSGIIKEWLDIRSQYENKAQADTMYIGKCQLEHPDMQISRDILYRKLRAYKDNDTYGLVDKRGGHNKGKSSIPGQVWDAFLWYWLDENQPSVSLCYRNVINWTEQFFPELVEFIPSERSFRRHIDSDINYAVKVLMRNGEKAFSDRCLPYMMRLYDNLEANECWIADNHTLDIQSLDDESKVHRLYLTAFLDAKTGVLTGWNITDSPSSQSTMLALKHGISRFGAPKSIYVDNGREFLNKDFGGMGHRKRTNTEELPSTILQRLGIEMHNALVCNARAKPVERTFSTVKGQFSKVFSGYCGGTILERPQSLKRRIKNGELPRDYEIRDFFDAWIDGDYNLQPYGGSETCYKGMSRLEVWNKTCTAVRQAKPEELNLMLMRSSRAQKIKRNGVYIEMFGEKIWYMNIKQTVENLQKKVYVRYDPADLRTARLYDEDDRYLFTWKLADALLVDYITEKKEEIADGEKLISTVGRFIKNQAKGVSENLTTEQRITMFDMSLRKAQQNKQDKFKIELPTNIIPIRANEPKAEEYKKAVGAEGAVIIDLDKIARNAKKRKGD